MKTKTKETQPQRVGAAAEFAAPKPPAAVRLLAGALIAVLVVTGLLGVF